MSSDDRCSECGEPISTARREVSPNTVTCSRACSRAHTKRLNRQAQQAWRNRRRSRQQAAHPEAQT